MRVATRRMALTGAVLAFLSVALGAFGAHGLKPYLSERMAEVYQTAVEYQVFHALAILFLASFSEGKSKQLLIQINRVFGCFVFGVIFFCGSLYLMAVTHIKWLGAITPIGGLAFLLGWGLLIMGLAKQPTTKEN